MLEKTEGIILHSLNYGDHDQIVTVFSNDQGVLKFIVKRAQSKKNSNGALTAPLTKAEFIFTRGRGEIFKCSEISSINQHLQLRSSWEHLSSAGDMAKAILETQMPQKPAPTLYSLMQRYLDKIPASTDPKAMSSSFRLKILSHDGLFHLTPACRTCGCALEEQHLAQGQSFCSLHAPEWSIQFTEVEMETLLLLTFCRSLHVLTLTSLSTEMQTKILQLFKSCLHS